jgi:hypothetical protein
MGGLAGGLDHGDKRSRQRLLGFVEAHSASIARQTR